jgi:ankyrin repeat protein
MPRISKTKVLGFVKTLDWRSVTAALREQPELVLYRAPRGENLLHVCCGVDVSRHNLRAAQSIKTADALIAAGIDIDGEAFREGDWKATPLWYAIARGKNLALAKHLLQRGANPEYCLWAAAYNDDAAAVRLLVDNGASIDATHDDGDTPLLFAVKWSRFSAARALLERGADVNRSDSKGSTPLSCALKKRSDPAHVRMLRSYGAQER